MRLPSAARRLVIFSDPGAGGAPRTAGFTLVELVVVIGLLAIVAAVATPRFFDRDTFAERGYADELAAALRYAQKLSVASGCTVRVSLAAGGYTLNQQAASGGHCDSADTSFPRAVVLPDGGNVVGSAPAGVTVAPSVVIDFLPSGGTALATDQTINVGGRSVTVVAASGLVRSP